MVELVIPVITARLGQREHLLNRLKLHMVMICILAKNFLLQLGMMELLKLVKMVVIDGLKNLFLLKI